MPSRKSQSISINTIIIAAIALAVLVVLFVIFTGRFKIFSEGVSSTTSCENTCRSLGKAKTLITADSCKRLEYTQIPGKFEDVTGQDIVCCCQ